MFDLTDKNVDTDPLRFSPLVINPRIKIYWKYFKDLECALTKNFESRTAQICLIMKKNARSTRYFLNYVDFDLSFIQTIEFVDGKAIAEILKRLDADFIY